MHYLAGDHQFSTCTGQQLLGNNGVQYRRKLYPNLTLLVAGESVDDAVNGIDSTFGVQGGKDGMAGFGSGHCGMHGFGISHFPQQNDIGCLAQAGAQSREVI